MVASCGNSHVSQDTRDMLRTVIVASGKYLVNKYTPTTTY
jgi:hypothetical protein